MIKNIINFLFSNSSKVKMSPFMMVETARKKVDEAFFMFKQAQETIKEANKELNNALLLSNENIHALTAKIKHEEIVREKAFNEITANKALSERLSEFIPK